MRGVICDMLESLQNLLKEYKEELFDIYGEHLKAVILYGSYARGDFTDDSDIDIMLLLDLTDMDIKKYRHQLSELTYDFNMEQNIDIKPIAKSEQHFKKWMHVYPFYRNIREEGVEL